MPLLLYQYTNTHAQVASIEAYGPLHAIRIRQSESPSNTPYAAGLLLPSPTSPPPTATATPTLIPTATPTPTPLSARLVQATAWQATLDQAAAFSHATQTQAAGQYAATQTALPPILTANAIDRAAAEP